MVVFGAVEEDRDDTPPLILIGVKTNIVSSVCNQVDEYVACRVVAKQYAQHGTRHTQQLDYIRLIRYWFSHQ